MNPVTKSLLATLGHDQLPAFIVQWDALEALIIRVFRAKAASAADVTEHAQIHTWLQAHYGDWRAVLQAYWPHTKIAKQPATADPFDIALAPEQASAFIDNWPIMQALPAARESLNHLILELQTD